MSDNKALWNRVCKTDPKHVKPITGKQYQGNSPKPYWIVERLTDEFGPCGDGWGFEIVNERFERLTDDDVLHVARVSFWHGDRSKAFEQMGQTKAVYRTSKGSLMVDEDAPKKSVTDALVKCASYLGFAGDIFSGRWDDSKYVAELRKEFAGKETMPEPTRGAPERAMLDDPIAGFSPPHAKIIRLAAAAAIQAFDEGNQWSAFEEVTSCVDKIGQDDQDRRNQVLLALSNIFQPYSALRTYLKEQMQKANKPQEQPA